MSSQAEDIIRETISSLAKAIGVQIDIPDEMITNLGAVLQAQIGLLAELQSTGRLIPAGGMALTAEQVEDVKIVLGQLECGGPAFEAAHERLRALFPATEPAEEPREIGWFRTMTPQFATKHFGFPEVTGLLECTHTASDGGTWGWGGDGDWELLVYPPAPAEPAEEWCIIHRRSERADSECMAPAEPVEEEAVLAARGEGWYEGYEVGLEYGPIAASGEEYDGPINPYDVPASSPVVPAPTETGPWA